MIGPSRLLEQPGSITRPALMAASFFVLFALFDSAARLFETFPNISLCYLPAGLCLALVLVFGPHYALLIAVAHLATDLWIRPAPNSLGDAVIHAFAVGATYLGAAVLLSKILGRTRGVQNRTALALFLLGGVFTSICFSLVTVIDLWSTGLIEWHQTSTALTHGTMGSLLGIFSVTPFIILVAAPQLERVMEGIGIGNRLGQVSTSPADINRLAMTGVGAGFALFGLVVVGVVTLRINDPFLIFCFLLPPFLGVALLAGLEVFASAALGAVLSSAIMQWDLGYGLQQTLEFHALLLLVVVNGMLIGTIVSEKKLLQGTDTFREGVLDSVSFAAQRLAGVENWETYFTEVLRQLGEASRSTYLCLFEAWPSKGEYTFELFPYDWASSKYSSDREQLVILNGLRSRELTRRIQTLGGAEVWRDPPDNSTHEEKAVWTASGVRFTLITPVFVERELWGCLVLGRTEDQKDWSRREIDSIRYAVRTLGSLFASARAAEQIQQLSENIRGDLWISSPDGHRRIGLSRNSEGSEGRDLTGLPDSWMENVHPEDIAKIESALSGRGDFDLEYRIVLSDQSVRWVRDRGFVVRNEVGQISRVIGMAEDVTTQKSVEENLEQSVDLLAALLDKEGSGILVEDDSMRVSHVNKEFFELLKIEAPSEQAAGLNSGKLFSESKLSSRRIESIRSSGVPVVDEEIRLNGSVLNLNYVPLSISRLRRYHLWEFRDVVEEEKADTVERSDESLAAMSELLRKTYQDTRNDLQVIYGVLKLQSSRVSDEQIRRYFAADQTRVMAIAMVHEKMSKAEDLACVDFPGYARNLTEQLVKSYHSESKNVQVSCDIAQLPLRIGTAIPCGLIINELVSNSLLYAFPEDRPGEVLIRFGQLDGQNFRLTVQDNGIGFPKGLDFKKTSTLGLMLVTGLTQQLGGTIALRNESGTTFDISFPSNGNLPAEPSIPAPVESYPSHQTQTVSQRSHLQ